MKTQRTQNTMGPEQKISGHFICTVKGRQSLTTLPEKKNLLSEANGSISVKLSWLQAWINPVITELFDKQRVGQAETTLTFRNQNPIDNYPFFSAHPMQSLKEGMGQALMRYLLQNLTIKLQDSTYRRGRKITPNRDWDNVFQIALYHHQEKKKTTKKRTHSSKALY